MNKIYKADLHVHSSYSNKPSIWILKNINCAESYTSPIDVYKTAKKRGMDYVTITDHDTIEGVQEIAHLPGAFISAEITTYFPENDCKLHVVVLDIDENIFKDIQQTKNNVYDLVEYLQQNGITHYIAHPLYDNERLSVELVEKMLLLFEVFEVRNGARSKRFNLLIKKILASLNREKIEFLASKHNIQPYGNIPWERAMVGGSDDHSGLFIAGAYTASKRGETIKDFIDAVKKREVWAEGEDGGPLTLAHSIYSIGYQFLGGGIATKKYKPYPFINASIKKFFNLQYGKAAYYEKFVLFIRMILPTLKKNYDKCTFLEIINIEVKKLIKDKEFSRHLHSVSINRKIFTVTSHFVNRLMSIYTDRLLKMLPTMNVAMLGQSLGAIGLVQFLMSPYYVSFHQQQRNKGLINGLENNFFPTEKFKETKKIALFTDTLNEINGVAITIKRIIGTARKQGDKLVVISASPENTCFKDGIMNFRAIRSFDLPEYPEIKMYLLPILDVVDYIEKEEFTGIHISTPGTMGLFGLFIAKLMDLPVSGTYHTNFPQYVKNYTNDSFLENVTWKYMYWFYRQMEEVMVPSMSTKDQLIEKGFDADKLRHLERWVNTAVFSPAKKDPYLWGKYGINGGIKFLYVGRVSKEKNLKLLANAFIELVNTGHMCNLVIAGDGPYKDELARILDGYPVLFTGLVTGEDLCRIYASSDVFVFPSTTDTFGNVVLEAQASGLPVIVSHEGGPKELMINGKTGLIFNAGDQTTLVEALKYFHGSKNAIYSMGRDARKFTELKSASVTDVYNSIFRSFADPVERTDDLIKI